jgi:hypothetical protein
MNKHLQDAKTALERPGRTGGQPRPGDILTGMHKAIESMLKYLEELDDDRQKPIITVNK